MKVLKACKLGKIDLDKETRTMMGIYAGFAQEESRNMSKATVRSSVFFKKALRKTSHGKTQERQEENGQ
ncbi:MAG: hypothetical protein NC299_14585 [Lachnospiraceae bacterium]|nr:hypothetical protein [Lachnospiraceae bacterium]